MLVTWIVLAVLVGFWSSSKLDSFAQGFFISLVLSPIIGAIFVIASKPHYICRYCGHDSPNAHDFCPICGKNKQGKTIHEMQNEYYNRRY